MRKAPWHPRNQHSCTSSWYLQLSDTLGAHLVHGGRSWNDHEAVGGAVGAKMCPNSRVSQWPEEPRGVIHSRCAAAEMSPDAAHWRKNKQRLTVTVDNNESSTTGYYAHVRGHKGLRAPMFKRMSVSPFFSDRIRTRTGLTQVPGSRLG